MDLITTPVVFGQSPPANSIVHSTSVSLTNRSPSAPVHLVQYDDTLPIIAVALTSNSQRHTVPSGAAVNVRLAKPDGHYVYNPAYGVSDDGQTVYIAVTVQMTAVSGKVSPIIEVVVNGKVAGTGFFVLDIDPNPIPEDAIESTDEYKTIQQLAAQVQQAAQVVQDNAESIQYVQENAANIASVAQNGENISAVGESIANVNTVAENLTPIQTAARNIAAIQQAPQQAANAAASARLSESWAVGGTGTREGENTNNAKYWSEQARTIAQGQLGWYATPQALQSAHPTGQNGQWAFVGTTDTVWTWDSDTNQWVDSNQQPDMSQYYTKAEANATFVASSVLLDLVYPVGSIYMSTNNTSPQTFLGGTWQQIQGRFLLASSGTHPAGSTGGAETVALTGPQNGPHDHDVLVKTTSATTTQRAFFSSSYDYNASGLQSADTSGLIVSSGSGEPHENMPPYLAVYMWQRTA